MSEIGLADKEEGQRLFKDRYTRSMVEYFDRLRSTCLGRSEITVGRGSVVSSQEHLRGYRIGLPQDTEALKPCPQTSRAMVLHVYSKGPRSLDGSKSVSVAKSIDNYDAWPPGREERGALTGLWRW
ncbi:hypothetical protein V1477_019311 [Vespula maculifrons]|uniref:Uncharacterized protein n=2 Tax=Vespula TaxID=7451 RepID=A0A834MPC8_VESVU|nr:hypothetical protein HZH66_014560 [Vespula vulgaris]